MAIHSLQERCNYINEAEVLLNKSKYLTENESIYYPEMVPIKESITTGKKIIRLEDLLEYTQNNGITDATIALTQICEASNVNPTDLAFSVDEVSIIEDADMEDTAKQFVLAKTSIYSVPISENNIAYILGEACLKSMAQAMDSGEYQYADAICEAYVNDEFEYLNDELIQSNLPNTFTEDNVYSAIDESNDNNLHWTAEKISTLRSLTRNYLEEGSDIAEKFYKGINYLHELSTIYCNSY